MDREKSCAISALDPGRERIERAVEPVARPMTEDSDSIEPDSLETAVPVEPPQTAEVPGEASTDEDLKRRQFLQKAGSIVVGGAIVACPLGVGLVAVADPLIKKSAGGLKVRLTVLDALPADGVPRAFKVIADKVDAWTTYQDVPLGMVFLRHTEDGKVEAFNASCPHAGCAVEYRNDEAQGQHYYCPCHESSFEMDGKIKTAETPALRGLDALEVDDEKLGSGEVWVQFEKFKAGVAEKISVS